MERLSIPAQRQQIISEFLKQNITISVREAAELCMVSEATARRDLDEMASTYLVERTHGGAVLKHSTVTERKYSEKMQLMVNEKQRIARAAAKMIAPGESIFLDSGSTTYFLAKLLIGIDQLTVVTNSLDIAYSIQLASSSTMIVTGGVRRDGFSVLTGNIAEELTRGLCVDISFLGTDAIDVESGLYNSNVSEIVMKRNILRSGRKKVLLADHSKFETKALTKVCEVHDLDVVITDTGIKEKYSKSLKEKVKTVIIA